MGKTGYYSIPFRTVASLKFSSLKERSFIVPSLISVFRGDDARLELEEYQESSREVETELDAQLKQSESQTRELRSTNHRLLFDYNSLKVRTHKYSGVHEL